MLQILIALVVLLVFYYLVTGLFKSYASDGSTLAYVDGPPSGSWIIGNQAELMQSEVGAANYRWRSKYGNVYRFRSCFGVEWLMLNDPKAIAHVLQGQTTTYHLEESLREFLRLVTGEGIIYADGADHARQRRLLQPAFSPAFVKSLGPQFAECAYRVATQWSRLLENGTQSSAELNAYEWAEHLTMEAIGQTAFGIRFGAIEGEDHELARAYRGFISTAFSRPTKLMIVLQALALQIPPWLLKLADSMPLRRVQALKTAKATSLAFARRIIQEKRRQGDSSDERDLLSILSRAGEHDVNGKYTRMSEDAIYAQLTTFFVAGYETSCNTFTFALYEIARSPAIQNRLYSEIIDVLGHLPEANAFGFETLDRMLYLQAVVKETLRFHSVVAHGLFKAGKENVIPLSKPILSRRSDRIDAVAVRKGQRVFLSFDGVNKLEDVWGPDAHEFKPERWLEGRLDDPPTEARCGGPYANLANFGGGPKTCLAWRFAIIELQTFIAVLVGRFHLEIASPDFRLRKDGCNIVVTPTAQDQEDHAALIPLRIRARDI